MLENKYRDMILKDIVGNFHLIQWEHDSYNKELEVFLMKKELE